MIPLSAEISAPTILTPDAFLREHSHGLDYAHRFNQPKPLGNSNLFLSDTPLREALQREQGGWDAEVLASLGQQLGTRESLELGRSANANPPELLRYDATGQRLDDVRFHPARHILMQGLIANRVHNLPGRRMRASVPSWRAPRALCCMRRLRPVRCAR